MIKGCIKILIIVFALSSICIAVHNNCYYTICRNSLYYLFSTIAQTFGSLLAIMVAVFVFFTHYIDKSIKEAFAYNKKVEKEKKYELKKNLVNEIYNLTFRELIFTFILGAIIIILSIAS